MSQEFGLEFDSEEKLICHAARVSCSFVTRMSDAFQERHNTEAERA
jgi:hypothetical protein